MRPQTDPQRMLADAAQTAQLSAMVNLGGAEVDVLGPFLRALPSSIYGGTNEIQRNLLARDVLRLPS